MMRIGRRAVWACAVVLAGCAVSPAPVTPQAIESVPVEGTTWQLASLGGVAVQPGTAMEQPTLRLDASTRRASGNTGCNSFGGSYTRAGDRLTFGDAAMTRRACASGMDVEQRYVTALRAADRFEVAGDRLTLYAGTRVLAEFRSLKPNQ